MMDVTTIPFRQTGYFSKLICDYIEGKTGLKPFYNRFPTIENFGKQIIEKKENYNHSFRTILHECLHVQYAGLPISKVTHTNIDILLDEQTYTVVTGHQLNLFTGPLYFLYKILSTINLTKALKQRYPKNNFVPVYWMATEDHDFDEINFFNFRGKKLQWNKKDGGPVGRFDLGGLDAVLKVVSDEFGNSKVADELKGFFEKAYLGDTNLAGATRYLVNALFGDYGLVILDGDDANLKKILVPYAKTDIFETTTFKEVSATIDELRHSAANYQAQVNPREINYFYCVDGLRERIVEVDGSYVVNNTSFEFSRETLEIELAKHPERFSPNVITRPLYQELILPNLAYIGGGGELAYWLQLKSNFDANRLTFPILVLRNSVLILTQKQQKKCDKLNVSISDLFLGQNRLVNKKIREISNIEIDFSSQKTHLQEQFKALYLIAKQTDSTFEKAIKAQETKQKKGLDVLEKRLLKAQKRKLKDHVIRLTELQDQLFPNKSLQEREVNFSELYLEFGEGFMPSLLELLHPLQHAFLILRH